VKKEPCRELQAAGRESGGRKHSASAGYQRAGEVGPGHDYCSKSSHRSQKPIDTFTLRELW